MDTKARLEDLERRVKKLEEIVGGPSAHDDFYNAEVDGRLDPDKLGC